ncbi:hypothetical protein AB1Y20_021678 [Prymnesium parvum]|uniref:Peptidylprolyl isomerase n=1 Tax=Prymnesium parvum TaxID=97485 RepID=A0AB34JK54_PRYPA
MSHGSQCLAAPLFLGVHTLNLAEELRLDGGALHIVTGAAAHNDVAAQLQHDRAQPQRGIDHSTAGPVFSLPSANGSRRIGGCFLRATLGGTAAPDAPFTHLWLDVARPDKASLPSLSEAGLLQRLGPYRFRVLSSRAVPGIATEGALEHGETLLVTVAVDKLRQDTAAIAPLLEPCAYPADEEQKFWLSTQGTTQTTLVSSEEPAAPPDAIEVDERFVCSLPPLHASPPPHAVAGHANSIELRLHTVLRQSTNAAPTPETETIFGCAPSIWTAELDGMSLGETEDHLLVPLDLTDGPRAPQSLRLGTHELRILQCVGHYARTGAKPGELVSEYPLLLLHVEVGLRKAANADVDTDSVKAATKLAEARRLGDGLDRLLS